MEFIRTLLIALVLFLSYTLYESWNKDHTVVDKTEIAKVSVSGDSSKFSKNSASDVPSISDDTKSNITKESDYSQIKSKDIISVKTNELDITIDKVGGNIVGAKLLKYNKTINTKDPLVLLSDNPKDLYVAPNGLTGKYGPDNQESRAFYFSEKDSYNFKSKNINNNSLNKVDLVWYNQDKTLKVVKTYEFSDSSYLINVKYKVFNNMNKDWDGHLFGVLKQKYNPQASSGFIGMTPFQGVAYYDQNSSYQKIAFSNVASSKTKEWSADAGWMAMVQHYFLSAWIPPKSEKFNYKVSDLGNEIYSITMWGPKITVKPNSTYETDLRFYVGPEDVDTLAAIAPGLERTVDYGILWPIASVIFKAMDFIHSFVGNWGWSIVLVTVLIKLLFYKLSNSSYRSMARMKNLAPKINSLKEKYGDDKQKMGQAMMELYRKEKVNPIGGCLPMIIQIPFFISLYWVIMESVQLRQAPFIFWINDLATYDPYFILPIIMGASMLVQQKLSPPPADPQQAKVMMLLPVIFTALFLYLPSGLVLYWSVNNGLSILQQWYVMKTEEKHSKNKKGKGVGKNKKDLNLKKISVNQLSEKALSSE